MKTFEKIPKIINNIDLKWKRKTSLLNLKFLTSFELNDFNNEKETLKLYSVLILKEYILSELHNYIINKIKTEKNIKTNKYDKDSLELFLIYENDNNAFYEFLNYFKEEYLIDEIYYEIKKDIYKVNFYIKHKKTIWDRLLNQEIVE